MRILDTRKAKERRDTEATDEREKRQFEEWLSGTNTAPLNADELRGIWGLWDGHGGRSITRSTRSPQELKRLAESLRRQLGLPQASP